MALLYLDSCGDHYTAAEATRKWTTALVQFRETGLHGYGLRGALGKGIIFGSTTAIIEAHVKRINAGGVGLFTVADENVVTQVIGSVLADGSVLVTRYATGFPLLGQSAPGLIQQDQWYHLGIRVKVHASAGELEVRRNGAAIIGPLTSLNTTGNVFGTSLRSFGLGGNDTAMIFDDLVVMDDVDDGINDPRLPGGGGYDKFLGAMEVRVKRPSGAGLKAEWTPNPVPPNWSNVSDVESNDDVTTNRATAGMTNVEDLHAMQDLDAGEDILAAQHLLLARKTEEGTAAVAALTAYAGTTLVGPTAYLGNTYTYALTPLPLAPGGARWSKAIWDATQLGYRKVV